MDMNPQVSGSGLFSRSYSEVLGVLLGTGLCSHPFVVVEIVQQENVIQVGLVLLLSCLN